MRKLQPATAYSICNFAVWGPSQQPITPARSDSPS